MITVGVCTKVLKKDGTLLFKPILRDSDFLDTITGLYHATYGTYWKISSLQKVSRGYHIKFARVNNEPDANFLLGEAFALPEEECAGHSVDLLIGSPVADPSGAIVGKVIGYSETPEYYLIEVALLSGGHCSVPLKPAIAEFKNGTVAIIAEQVLCVSTY